MEASIIIITKDQKEFLQKTLPVLLNQEFKGKYEIIVVDSGSTDDALQYIKSLPINLVQISPETFNYARAFNTGAKKAKGKLLIRLSGDCLPQDNFFLKEILDGFEDTKVGGTYGRYISTGLKGYRYPEYWPASRFSDKRERFSIKPYLFMGLFETGKSRENLYNFAGGCCAIRKSIWEKRPFNEKLTEGEDAEYSWFLHLIGFDIIYNPNANVIHDHKIKTADPLRWIEKSLIFTIELLKYWLRRILFSDPYKNFHYKEFK